MRLFLGWSALAVQVAVANGPVGANCNSDADCASRFCFSFSEAAGLGVCACRLDGGNVGCANGELCYDDPWVADEAPACIDPAVTLLPTGRDCYYDRECFSASCFYNPTLVGTACPGVCACVVGSSANINAGCTAERPYCYDNPNLDTDAPVCILLPLGSVCSSDSECESGGCFVRPGAASGVCVCRLETNEGCDGGTPLCYDNPWTEGEAPVCINPSTLLAIGSSCFYDTECQSFRCYIDDQLPQGSPGVCACSSETNAGCDAGFFCEETSGAAPFCFLSGDNLLGESCTMSRDCASNNCFFQGTTTAGVCTCNSKTNAGCDSGSLCAGPDELGDFAPECVVTSGVEEIGASCIRNVECLTSRCFFTKQQPPYTPGSCQCNSETNRGCAADKVCSDKPAELDGFPECVDPNMNSGGLLSWIISFFASMWGWMLSIVGIN